jgi:hypothetical protein
VVEDRTPQASNGAGRYLKEAGIRIVRGMEAGSLSSIWSRNRFAFDPMSVLQEGKAR